MPTQTIPETDGQSYLGVGLYSIPEAARILQKNVGTVRNWAKGYKYFRGDEKHEVPAIIKHAYPELYAENLLTFEELVEMHVIKLFRDLKVPMHAIRRAATRLSLILNNDHPFTVKGLLTDGKLIFYSFAEGHIEQLDNQQLVIDRVLEQFLKKLEYKNDKVSRMWPIGIDRVLIDPGISFGKPVVYPTGVPTYALYQMYKAGEDIEKMADWWEVSVREIEDAIEFEKLLEN